MRCVMKSVLRLCGFAAVAALFAGCYTELATIEQNDQQYVSDSDTAYENGNTTINNHYYLDDDYRRSRFRVSFNYYYPTYSPWISSYYYSYFDDPYWGMYPRPMWGYDPFYPHYGGCLYPSPYYDPWYPYYSPVAYYPGYFPSSVYGNNPGTPNRTRTGGSTRDPQSDIRSRPLPSTIPQTDPSIPVTSTGTRLRDNGEALPAGTVDKGRTPEKPWWEKMNTDRPTRVADEGRPTAIERKGTRSSGESVPAYTPPVRERPSSTTDERPVERPKNTNPSYTSPKSDRPGTDARPVEQPKRNEPRYSPPVKQSVPKDEARPVERNRETRQPSYNPPSQSSHPQSAPPRSSSGSTSTGTSGRKRD